MLVFIAAALVASSAIVGTLVVAKQVRSETARCPEGLEPIGPSCCGEGQELDAAGHCTGTPTRCARNMQATPSGCVLVPERVTIAGGKLELGPSDWEAAGVVERRTVRVAPFALDRGEVTWHRWTRCEERKRCPKLELVPGAREPGRPVTGISAQAAAAYCRLVGGRLPTGDEWLFAAAGASGRRFPWGATGLVCRRAAFGLEEGPCAFDATGPDLVGARPAGATPDGVLDLAGNVAEWTREKDGYAARGGSFRSRSAQAVKSWAADVTATADPTVGFRCAYDLQSPKKQP